MAVVDTSWLVALLNPDDAHHAKARTRATLPGPFVVPYTIMAEALQVVTIRLSQTIGPAAARRGARGVLRQLYEISTFRFEATTEAHYRLASRYYARDPKLSFFDAVAVAHAKDAELLTFDKVQRGSHQDPLPT